MLTLSVAEVWSLSTMNSDDNLNEIATKGPEVTWQFLSSTPLRQRRGG